MMVVYAQVALTDREGWEFMSDVLMSAVRVGAVRVGAVLVHTDRGTEWVTV